MSSERSAASGASVSDTPRLRRAAPVFAALGDPTRLRLVAALSAAAARSTLQLTSGSDMSRQAITKHLLVLADAGLARSVKIGRERRWELVPDRLDEAVRSLESITRSWDRKLGRLRSAVEGRDGSGGR